MDLIKLAYMMIQTWLCFSLYVQTESKGLFQHFTLRLWFSDEKKNNKKTLIIALLNQSKLSNHEYWHQNKYVIKVSSLFTKYAS